MMDRSQQKMDIATLFAKKPGTLPLYQAIESLILEHFPDVMIKVSKTQVSFVCRYGFAFVSLPVRPFKGQPDLCVVLTFGLGRHEHDPRIAVAVEPYPGRWTHHVLIAKASDLDAQIVSWLTEAYHFAMTK